MKLSIVAVIAFLATVATCQNLTEIVHIDKGPVRGFVTKTAFHNIPYSAFLGIPYAKPPVGDLRFKAPVEINPWTNVYKAILERDACPQIQEGKYDGSEDCLHLNVYTPRTDFTRNATLKPVLVWIHGGGFINGVNAKDVYGPDWYIEEDVIMVAMKYRLGPLGFLSLDHPDARGNQGLKDQNMALRWVQKNIAKFGGDPNRVTIQGESAGAVSTSYHLMSKQSKGLFHQAIVQSGSSLCPWGYKSPAASRWTSYVLGKNMNISADNDDQLLKALKKADVRDIITVATPMTNENIPLPLRIAFVPTTESGPDAFVEDCPLSYFESGNFNQVPTLLGYTAQESILYSLGLDFERQSIQAKLLSGSSLVDLTGHNHLFINTMNAIVNDTVWEMIKASSLYVFSGPMDLMHRLLTKNPGHLPVYFYRLSYDTEYNWHREVNPNIGGTSHADDLPMTFYFGGYPKDPNHPINVYAKKVTTMWVNFIKYGNPTPFASKINGTRWIASGKQGLQLDLRNDNFVMSNRFIVDRDALVMEKYYNGLPVTSECKNYPLSTSRGVFN
ncbi:juvenile hormone esterase-like isoform X1 [Hylaeus anthracinus]|uniref:juvenile hormone esterase-like isoform X1 n=1 Tax=Hylaeus anthracinus TaxID=313031 RepID=UPI0023B98779|nr:juvenile hormone esterase-like isoform X1 [Hylaeus anthracinus]